MTVSDEAVADMEQAPAWARELGAAILLLEVVACASCLPLPAFELIFGARACGRVEVWCHAAVVFTL